MKTEKPQTLHFDLNNNPKYDTGLVCGGTLEVFVEPVLAVSTLYIFGAGHVAWSLYKVARLAGFDVVVTDDRESYANRERFPDARDIYADEYERVTAQLAPNDASYIVIVTRGHRDDMRVLRWAAETPARYIGMIGSQRKTIAIYKELEKEGIAAGEAGARLCAGGHRYWRHHAGRNCRGDCGRADRHPPQLRYAAAAHEEREGSGDPQAVVSLTATDAKTAKGFGPNLPFAWRPSRPLR